MSDDNSGDKSQAAFWAAMIKQLAGKMQGQGNIPANNVMMAGTAIECNFGEDDASSNYAIWEIADTVPKWSLTWDGEKTGDFFGTYQHWLSEIHPTVVNAGAQDQLVKIKQQIVAYNDGIGRIMKEQYGQFLDDNCLTLNKDGTCAAWLPGTSASQFGDYWKTYKTGTAYKQQLAALTQEIGQDLAGLQSQYNTLAQMAYGANYQQLEEAQAAVTKADPMADNSSLTDKQLAPYQMPTKQGSATINLPRYVAGVSTTDFNAWVANARQATSAQLTMQLQTSDHETDTSHWQFSAGGGFPVEDIFMISAEASGSNTTVHIQNYDFNMLVSYQAVLYVPLNPATSWYVGSLLPDYRNFAFTSPSQFAGHPLWGPQGMFNLRVTGCYVAYGQSTKFTVANWDKFTSDTKWSEKVGFSLFGLINIASESSSGETTKTKITSSNTGFEMTDVSGVPKIIALTVDTINYP